MNVKELIEYLQGYPDDADVHINVIDTHMDKKYGFVVERFAVITDEKDPIIFLDINHLEPVDITKKE